MKKISSKLSLTKESLRLLDPAHLESLAAGYTTTTVTIHCSRPPCNTTPTCFCA
jgi:hypothetical protein